MRSHESVKYGEVYKSFSRMTWFCCVGQILHAYSKGFQLESH